MEKTLTFKEKRYIENLMKNSKDLNAAMWPSWSAWAVFALGGFLIAYVCFLTASNLSPENIKNVLMPGIFAGMVLLIGGYWIQYMSKKLQDDKILAGILKKVLEKP